MTEGIYLPLGLWDKLEASGQLRGPRGGTVLNYENVERYLTNTHIIGLVERAWVGSSGATSKQIGEVIKHALAGGNSLILAADDNARPSAERFADADQRPTAVHTSVITYGHGCCDIRMGYVRLRRHRRARQGAA